MIQKIQNYLKIYLLQLQILKNLEEDDLVVYPESDLVADIYITGKLSDLQKITEDDIHIYGTINNPIEGKNIYI